MNPHTKALTRLGSRQSVRVSNNTFLERHADGESIALRLHRTQILIFHPDGSAVATSGGWKTATTKDRLNSWLPHGWGISQDRGRWFWSRGVPQNAPSFKPRAMFTDGDRIGPRGALTAQATASTEKAATKDRRAVLAFAKLCADALPIEPPSGGDCWHCAMRVSSGPSTGKTLGDAFKNTEHLRSHMEEGYVVPSLVLSALTEHGATDAIKAAAFGQTLLPLYLQVARRQVRAAVASYLFRRFGMVARGGWAKGSPVSGYTPHCAAV